MAPTQTHDAYYFSSCFHLTEAQLNRLIDIFKRQPHKSGSILGGRSSVSVDHIDGIGPVVVKYYTRGGLIHYLVKRRYLKWGKTRSQIEYELLQKIRKIGINAPEPVVQAYRGHLFYKAWLVTREIRHPLSLVRLSMQDETLARRAANSVTEQISLLIQNNILHVDLHPGNVVVDDQGRVFLVDFDKGRIYSGSKTDLRDRYIARWRRAIIKHRLPMMLNDIMVEGLQDN
jgi:3-deoxy-D-manno-octulosonic acid kinase